MADHCGRLIGATLIVGASAAVLAFAATHPKGAPSSARPSPASFDYLGQTPPGDEPVVFAPGIVSVADKNSHAVQFSRDGRLLIFSRYPDRTSFVMIRTTSGWSAPEPTSFHGKEVAFDEDTGRLFYYDEGDLFFVRYGVQGFSAPVRLPPAINTDVVEYYPCVTARRNLYFSRHARWDEGRLQVARLEGDGFGVPRDLGDPINAGGASHGFVTPDESTLLFNSPRPGSTTDNDVWVSFRGQDGTWSTPANLGPRINGDAQAVLCPTVSPDGKYLFFTRLLGDHTGFVYWVSMRVVSALRPGATPAARHRRGTPPVDRSHLSAIWRR